MERLAKFLSPGICALKETELYIRKMLLLFFRILHSCKVVDFSSMFCSDTDAVRTADRELQQIQKIVEESGEGLDHWDFDNLKSNKLMKRTRSDIT